MVDVFVSKPNVLNPSQSDFWYAFGAVLSGRGLNARTLGDTDYPNDAPVAAVLRVMRECSGAVLLGLVQAEAHEAVFRRWTPREETVLDLLMPTPWNQLEGGIAFALGLPLLIVRQRGIVGGMFDTGASDRFVHEADLSADWVRSDRFLQPFRQWATEVEQLAAATK
jgi:hypothetical protein